MDFKYPYTDFHELNLDWFLAEFKKLTAEWLQVQHDWEDEQQAFQDLHDYVQDYFANLNLYQEVHDVLYSTEMQQTIQLMLTNISASQLPAVVANQIASVVASQLAPVVAAQLPNLLNGMLPSFLPDAVAGEAAAWLADHVDPDTGYVIDDTMSIALAAADAAAVGTLFADKNNKLGAIDYRVNQLITDNDITSGSGYVDTSGDVQVQATTCYKASRKFACIEGQKWYYMGYGASPSASWLFYKGNVVVSYGQINSQTTYTEVTIPNGVDGVKFCSYKETSDVNDVVLNFKPAVLTDDEKTKIQKNIGAFKKFVSYNVVPGTNLYDGTKVLNEYVAFASIVSAPDTARTNIIALAAGDYLVNCRKAHYGNNAVYIRLYDDNDNFITRISGTIILDDGNNSIMQFTLTEDCGVMFNVYYTTTMLVRGSTIADWPNSYLPYDPDKKIIDNGFMLNSDMLTYINPLYKKYIAADGDSISYGNYADGYAGGYAKMIADNNIMDYQNLSVSGATIAAETYVGGSPRHWICRSMSSISSDADYILIEGGVNDASLNVTLGSITAGYNDVLDDTTFYGAIESIFKTLTTTYVGKKYGFIIPHRMVSGMYPDGNYNKAIKECGLKWGVKVLDLSESVPPFNQFRYTADYDTIRNNYTKSGDGWHPTELCFKEYYVPQIEAFIKTL